MERRFSAVDTVIIVFLLVLFWPIGLLYLAACIDEEEAKERKQ